MTSAIFQVWRGDRGQGQFSKYTTEISEGMVVLDAIHQIQAEQANDLGVRWNCKAGKCGSCSAEINGMPRLMCMTRMNELPADKPVVVEPMKSFPHIRDLVTDVSWNFEVKKKIKKFKPRPPDQPDGSWRVYQEDVDRVQEFRKCIECFLCQDVCHVLREHQLQVLRVCRSSRDASARCRKPCRGAGQSQRHRLLQHHKVLYRCMSGRDQDHGQRHHPAQGTSGGRVL